MAENEQLEAFLKGEPAPEERASAPATEAAQPAHDASAAAPAAKAETPSPAAAEAATEADDDAVPELREGDRSVPLAALEGERTKRKSWVERASRAEAERDLLRKQLEDARKATEAPKPEQPQPIPFRPIDPAQDPAGYHARVQEVLLNERLNVSERFVRKEIGREKLDAAVAEFKEAAKADPSLYQKLYAHPDPYEWMVEHVEAMRALKEVGNNPAAWREAERERLRNEERAKLEAELGRAPAAARPNLQPSLVNARSAAPRSASTFTGAPSLDDILAPISRPKGGRGADARH